MNLAVKGEKQVIGGITSQDILTFHRRAFRGHVVDKDRVMKMLENIDGLYRELGVPGKQRRAAVGTHKSRALGGNAEEQFVTSGVISEVHAGLRTAVSRKRAITQEV